MSQNPKVKFMMTENREDRQTVTFEQLLPVSFRCFAWKNTQSSIWLITNHCSCTMLSALWMSEEMIKLSCTVGANRGPNSKLLPLDPETINPALVPNWFFWQDFIINSRQRWQEVRESPNRLKQLRIQFKVHTLKSPNYSSTSSLFIQQVLSLLVKGKWT